MPPQHVSQSRSENPREGGLPNRGYRKEVASWHNKVAVFYDSKSVKKKKKKVQDRERRKMRQTTGRKDAGSRGRGVLECHPITSKENEWKGSCQSRDQEGKKVKTSAGKECFPTPKYARNLHIAGDCGPGKESHGEGLISAALRKKGE